MAVTHPDCWCLRDPLEKRCFSITAGVSSLSVLGPQRSDCAETICPAWADRLKIALCVRPENEWDPHLFPYLLTSQCGAHSCPIVSQRVTCARVLPPPPDVGGPSDCVLFLLVNE